MKKRINAFTLIELLAVIVILAIIALIATPIILGIVEDTRRDAYLRDCELIEHAAELYIANELQGNVEEKEYIIPMSELNKYVNVTEDKLNENIIVKNIDGNLTYHYTGRDNNPYSNLKSLKEVIESDTDHIVKNTKVNGAVVNKVIGNKDNKYEQKNHVWYSGQLWQVLETNDNNHSIKLVTADPITTISYGETNDWDSSWAKQWVNEEFLSILERKDIIVDTIFCLDEPNITESIQELYNGDWLKKVTNAIPINSCQNSIIEKVGLMTVEDYAYALNGTTLNYQGNNFLDYENLTWTMTSYTGVTKTGNTTDRHVWVTWYNNPSYLTVLTGLNNEGVSAGNYENSLTNTHPLGIRPVISIKDNVLVKLGEGSKKNPYVLITEQELSKGDSLNNAKVGEYVYLDESNNPNIFNSQTALMGASYASTKDKVRYRIVKINEDETIKLERADLLKNLPDTISMRGDKYVPYYYKVNETQEQSCIQDVNGIYFEQTSNKTYTSGCTNYNIFNPTLGTGDYKYTDGENIGYFLNNATNSFYNWYSDSAKKMIEESKWNLSVVSRGKDYKESLYNEDEVGTYPSTTNDGYVNAYVGLPQYGEIYTGNDLISSYWHINRWSNSIYDSSRTDTYGRVTSISIPTHWNAIRPVIVVKNNVKVSSGAGTISNPYSLSL